MITVRKAEERGHANHGWLDTYHSFSFADYYDPQQMGFRALRVINEDRVAGGRGFDMHPHRDMEIITYVLSGALQHRDSMGNSAIMRAGDVQRITAGTGVLHSEFNHSPTEAVHLLQIWLVPDKKGVKPGYAERSFAKAAAGKLHLIASREARDGSLPINQDVDVYVAKLDGEEKLVHRFQPGRFGWLQVAEGEVQVNERKLKAGDGAGIGDERELRISGRGANLVFFDLN